MGHEGLEDVELSLHVLKTRFYLVALPFAIAGSLVVWILAGRAHHLTPFDRIAFPALAACLGATFIMTALGGLRRWPERRMTAIEHMVLAASAVFFLLRQAYVFHSEAVSNESATLISVAQWEAVVYLLIFLILPRRRALHVSLVYLGLAVAMGVADVVPDILVRRDFDDLNYLVQSAFSAAAVITLLYILALVKERYSATLSHAEAMTHLAMTDFLTGLPNRRQITDIIEGEIGLALRHGRTFSVIIFDLDHFKQVNDLFGHRTGDEVLAATATLVERMLRVSDWLARWGGEEFLIVAPEAALDQAAVLAERLRGRLEVEVRNSVGVVTATFGVASFRIGDTVDTLIQRADQALYRGKIAGRNRVELGHLAA